MSNQPGTINYPEGRQLFLAIVFVICACCGILLLLQPFGVNNYDPSERISAELLLGVGSFALAMLVVYTINEFLIRPYVLRLYTLRTVSLWLLWAIILGATVSYVNYNFLGGWHDWSFPAYLDFTKNWFILTALPMGLVVLYYRQHALKIKLQEVHLNEDDANQLFIFTSDNQKDKLALPVENILFLESQDNYISLVYLDEGETSRYLLRSTLKRMEEELATTPIHRCHRSFLVNTNNVISYQGNAHRLELRLKGTSETIPVSRNYTSTISELLEDNP